MDPISFCHLFSIARDVPFMFALALLNCMGENFDVEFEQIKKELADQGKSSIIEIQSDRKNYTGKPLGGITRKNGLDTDQNSPVIECFQFNGKNFYLVMR